MDKIAHHVTMAGAGEPERRLMHLAEVAALAEQAIVQVVEDMRAAGDSWARVGDALGVSRQAAQQRYGRRLSVVGVTLGDARPAVSDGCVR
jgi:hypothetical protein